jgi:hypothetical protein
MGYRWMRKDWAPAHKLLVALSCVTAAVEIVVACCVLLHINFERIYNVWGFVETGTILFIQFLAGAHTWLRRLLILLLVILAAGTVVGYRWVPEFAQVNFPVLLFSLFVQLIGSCVALTDVLLGTSDRPLSVQPDFWLATGMLFYCCIFIAGHILMVYAAAGMTVNRLYNFFIIGANIFMYGGFIACFKALRREDRRKNPVTSAA